MEECGLFSPSVYMQEGGAARASSEFPRICISKYIQIYIYIYLKEHICVKRVERKIVHQRIRICTGAFGNATVAARSRVLFYETFLHEF